MVCFVCSEQLQDGYLCEGCIGGLSKMIEIRENIITCPTWINHCEICGEFNNRILVDVPNFGPVCDKCILEEKNKHKMKKTI